MTIRIALIDDDQLLADALRGWAHAHPGLQLVQHAVAFAQFTAPSDIVDVVLLDLQLQDDTNPEDNVRTLVARGYRVLVISIVRDSDAVVATSKAGSHGYLTKDSGLSALSAAITEVAAGKPYYSRELVFSWLHDTKPERPALSDQERTVLLNYVSGMTLQAAARAAGIKPGTAKRYLDRVKTKYQELGRIASTKLDLADRAREDGLRR